MTRRQLSVLLVGLVIVSEALWIGFATLIVPPVITQAYRGESIPAINSFFTGESHPLAFYLQHWYSIATLGALFWPAFWGLAVLLRSPVFFQRYVGEATPGDLSAIRLLTCGILLISTLWEDLPSSAALPRALIRPMGVLELLYALPLGFEYFVASAEALRGFQWFTALMLFLGAIGWRTRLVVPVGALCYLILGGLLRQYAWFYHTGLVPLYVLFVLSLTPCGDGWSYDRWRRMRRGHPVPAADRATAVYGWSRYACWLVIALPYVAAGLSKIRNGGFGWLEAANFRSILYRSALSPMHFDFDVSLALRSAPDALIEVLALLALGGELLYGLVLCSRRARVLLPAAMVLMHLGILFLQNILFFDLILLQLVFLDITWLRRALARTPVWRRSTTALSHVVCRYGWRPSPDTSALASGATLERVRDEAASAQTGGFPGHGLVLSLSGVLLLCWLCRLEFYPLTGMQMFSARNTAGVVTYEQAVAQYETGVREPAPIVQCLGAMADSRYRRILAMAFDATNQSLCQEFFQTCASRWNRQAPPGRKIVLFEVQRWVWDFQAEPHSPTYGRLVQSRVYAPYGDVEKQHRQTSDRPRAKVCSRWCLRTSAL
jgi:hypothetical protein